MRLQKVPSEAKKSCHLEGHGRKYQDRSRIRYSVVRIRGSGSLPKCHGSTTLLPVIRIWCKQTLVLTGGRVVTSLLLPAPRSVSPALLSADSRGISVTAESVWLALSSAATAVVADFSRSALAAAISRSCLDPKNPSSKSDCFRFLLMGFLRRKK